MNSCDSHPVNILFAVAAKVGRMHGLVHPRRRRFHQAAVPGPVAKMVHLLTLCMIMFVS
jgi:hypothetical protein